MDKNTGISLGAVVIAAFAAGNSMEERETKTLVAASVEVDDVEVAEIVKASPTVQPVTCKKTWAFIDGVRSLKWICSDVGYDAGRQAVLNKRAGGDGVAVTYNPAEAEDGSLLVGVTVLEGDEPSDPGGELKPYVPPVIEEEEIAEVIK